MSAYTFSEFKKFVSPYAGRSGKCADDAETALFARRCMELLLYEGSDSAIRKLSILAYRGKISLPQEVAVPLKVRINRKVTEVWNKWHVFSSVQESFEKCASALDVIKEIGSVTPLAYSLPPGGSVVGILATCQEDDTAEVIVQGYDIAGKQVFTSGPNGEQVPGERFRLVKDQLRTGKIEFGEITGVLKPRTNGYVQCIAVNPFNTTRQFLADWTPNETRPEYRTYSVIASDCPEIAHISMLCRVQLKDSYSDNEFTLFENSLAIMLAAQRLQHELNDQVDVAGYKRQALTDILEKEGGYKKQSGKPLDVFHIMSGGSIKNSVRGYRR